MTIFAILSAAKKAKNDDHRYKHVNKIDGMHVEINLNYSAKYQMLYFYVEAYKFLCEDDEDEDDFNCESATLFRSEAIKMVKKTGLTEANVRSLLQDIERCATTLKYDEYCGTIMTYKREAFETHAVGNKCPACLMLTTTTTTCGHALCGRCYQSLVVLSAAKLTSF